MRIFLIIGGAVAAFFLTAAILLSVVVDPNKYKGDISRIVKEKTGRELVFEGDVKLNFFPWLGLETGRVSLGPSPVIGAGFGPGPFASVQAASIRIRILPLFARRVEAKKISLEGLELNLGRSESGLVNWADLTGQTPDEDKKDTSALFSEDDLTLDGVHVQNASITWTDLLTGKHYALTQADVTLTAIQPGSPFDFKTSFSAAANDPEIKARAEMTGTATLDIGGVRHVLNNLAAKVSATGAAVPGGKGEFTLGLAELKIDKEKQTAQGTGLTISGYGAKGSGQFSAANLKTGADVKGRLEFPDFNGRELSAALTGKALDTADGSAYQHITASVEFKAGRGYLEIPNFSAKLDDAVVEGRFRSTGFEEQAYSFNIRIQGLDADRFLPPKKGEDAAPVFGEKNPQAAAAPKNGGLFPVDKLRTMRLDGQITAERMKYRNLRYNTLKVPMSVQNGVLDIGPVDGSMYEGAFKSHLRVDVQGPTPHVSFVLNASGIQGRPLFTDLDGKPSQFAGSMSLDMPTALTGQGNTEMELRRTLAGRAHFTVRDGVFPGVNLSTVVHEGARKVKNAAGQLTPVSSEKSTSFGSIDGTAVINSGIATINDLEVKAPFLRGDGKGTVNIPTKQVDYTLRIKVVPNVDGQGGGGVLDMFGLVVPLRITGPYDNPSYTTDYLRSLGKGAVDVVGNVVGGAVNAVKGLGKALTGKKRIF